MELGRPVDDDEIEGMVDFFGIFLQRRPINTNDARQVTIFILDPPPVARCPLRIGIRNDDGMPVELERAGKIGAYGTFAAAAFAVENSDNCCHDKMII